MANKKKPHAQANTAKLVQLPSKRDATPASMIIGSAGWEPGPTLAACAELHSPVTFPSACECQAGSRIESNGSRNEPRIPIAQAGGRKAADRWRETRAAIEVNTSRIVVFSQHATRKANGSSEPPRKFIFSSPSALSSPGARAGPILPGRFAKFHRPAGRRLAFLRNRQKKSRPSGEERTAGRRCAPPLAHIHIAVHALPAARALFLQAPGAARAPSSN